MPRLRTAQVERRHKSWIREPMGFVRLEALTSWRFPGALAPKLAFLDSCIRVDLWRGLLLCNAHWFPKLGSARTAKTIQLNLHWVWVLLQHWVQLRILSTYQYMPGPKLTWFNVVPISSRLYPPTSQPTSDGTIQATEQPTNQSARDMSRDPSTSRHSFSPHICALSWRALMCPL